LEEYAYVLDYMPQGLPGTSFAKRGPVCYAVGEEEFKLFELVPKDKAKISIEDRVYIGKDGNLRKEIDHVRRRVSYNDLTGTAQTELDYIVQILVKKNEDRYVSFFNNAGPINIKKHLLEELPGMGKKTLEEFLKERRAGKFESFEDITRRVPILKTPEKLIKERIMLEITDDGRRRYIFISK
jgi:putative nucleotide binding protein